MKILYLHRTQGHGVESVHILGIARAAVAAGAELQIFGPQGSDPEAPPVADRKPGLAARFARHAPEILFEMAEMAYDRRLRGRLAAKIREFNPDLIYERYAFFASAGSDLAFDFGIPHIIEINYTCDDPLVRRRSGLLLPHARRVERRIFGRAAVLAPVSSRLAERVLERGVEPAKIVMTPNAVDRSWLEQVAGVTPRELPAKMKGLPVTGFVGGFWPWHGVDRLVTTAGRCAEQGLPTALLLVGEGPERERIGELVAELGLTETTLMPGNIAHDDLAPWIAAMDICVMPHSNDYGSPMKVFEYMGMGKAVLAPNLPPLVDVIDSGAGGLLFDTGDVVGTGEVASSLEDGLAGLLRDGELRRRMGEVALERVTREFTWQRNWERMMTGLQGSRPGFGESDSPTPEVER